MTGGGADAGARLRRIGHDLNGLAGALLLERSSIAELVADVRDALGGDLSDAARRALDEIADVAANLGDVQAAMEPLAEELRDLGRSLQDGSG